MTTVARPYLRRTRRWAWASDSLSIAALMAFLLLSASGAYLKAIEAAAPVKGHTDWASVVGYSTFAGILALAELATAILLWRRIVGIVAKTGAATRPAPEPARFRERWYVAPLRGAISMLLLSGGLMMVATGIIQVLTAGANEDPAVIVIFLGLLVLFGFYWMLAWFPLIRMPRVELSIDRNGLRASWIDPPEISWTEVTEIRAIPDEDGNVAESDLVLLALQRANPHWTSQVCVIDMNSQFGRCASELLATLDALRPPATPLVDPRRLDLTEAGAGAVHETAAFEAVDARQPAYPEYRRKTKESRNMPAWVLTLTVTFALLAGACVIVAGTWMGLPAKVALWAAEYRDKEIAWALTLTAFLMTPALALAITVIVSFVRYRREARAPRPTGGSVRPSVSGGLILGERPGDARPRPTLRLVLLALGLLPVVLGTAAIAVYGDVGMGVPCLLLGVTMSGMAAIGLRRDRRRTPKFVAVDAAGLHLREPVPFLLPWRAVGFIHAAVDSRAGNGLAAHVIDVYARQPLLAPKIILRLWGRKALNIGGQSIRLLRLEPFAGCGVRPEAILDALDRFRPEDVPIDDRWRIVDEKLH